MGNYPPWVQSRSDQMMHDDFKKFVYVLWTKHLNLPPPTKRQYELCDYLQHGPRRRMLQGFRGIGKSWITAAYVLWLLYRDPDHKVLVTSASKERSDAFSIFCKRLIAEVSFLRFLEPRDGNRTSNIAFDVGPARADQSPSVRSVGITGQMTGGRANTIIADDVEIPKNSATEAQREKLKEGVKEFDAILKPGGQVVYLGTFQNIQSLYLTLPGRGYAMRIWPAEFPEIDELPGYAGTLAPSIEQELRANPALAGKPTDPERFDELDLAERKASYGRYGYAMQFMLNVSRGTANKYPLRTSDLIVMDVAANLAPAHVLWASGGDQEVKDIANLGLNGDRFYRPMKISDDFAAYQGSVMIIDPSGRGKDETAYCVVKMLHGMLYVTAWGGLPGGYDEATLEKLAEIAKANDVNLVKPEANFGDGMFTSLLKPVMQRIHPVTIEEYKVTGQKEQRICDKLEPILNSHRLVIDLAVVRRDVEEASEKTDDKQDPTQYSGIYQLTHITRERGCLRHDDRIDVLAEGAGYWVEQVANDTEKAAERAREKARMAALQAHITACGANFMPQKKSKMLGKTLAGVSSSRLRRGRPSSELRSADKTMTGIIRINIGK